MTSLISAKGNNVTTWRAAGDFCLSYRQALLDQAAADSSIDPGQRFAETFAALQELAREHEAFCHRLNGLLTEVAVTRDPGRLRELTAQFYHELYDLVVRFHSAPAFYQMSMAFLRQLAATLVQYYTDQLGASDTPLLPLSLVALGPAGRGEFSPFCPLQLLVVSNSASGGDNGLAARFGTILHHALENTGLRVDPVITPRNPAWRGTQTEWLQRVQQGVLHEDNDSIDALRLADQYELWPGTGSGTGLKQLCTPLLRSRPPVLRNLMTRIVSLSNGLGLMGHLKLERRGAERGLFGLLDHGLLPLSAAVSALALINDVDAAGTPARVRELLSRRALNVDMAERILAAWHTLHELLLMREQAFRIDEESHEPLYLDPDQLDAKQRAALESALESVGIIQRHVGIIFSGLEE